jgi:hypothetical protein
MANEGLGFLSLSFDWTMITGGGKLPLQIEEPKLTGSKAIRCICPLSP